MRVACYPFLCDPARTIREIVFVEEQGFQHEFDDIDKVAFHLVAYSERGEAVATCRFFEDASRECYILGRLAVLNTYRGRGIGHALLAEVENFVRQRGGKLISLHAQCRAEAFYAKAGYLAYGEVEDDEGCPHIWMRKNLLA